MSEQLAVVLTSRDFGLLESLLHERDEPFPGAATIIRRKLASARLVFPADVPADVVTLNSRVRFRIGDAGSEERSLVKGRMNATDTEGVALNSARGLALIGAAVGQTVEARRSDGTFEELFIEAVLYQPEQKRPPTILTLVSRQDVPNARSVFPKTQPRVATSLFTGDDDPGPSAA